MTTLTIELDEAVVAKLDAIGERSGVATEEVVRGLLEAYANDEEIGPPLTQDQVKEIEAGLAELDAGLGVPHADAIARLQAKFG